ncbi:MAG: DUF4012 domain-containing protein [Actinomycetota bacterium]
MTTERPTPLDGSPPSPPHAQPRRVRSKRALLVVAALVVVAGILTLLDALAVARDLRRGRDVFSALTDRGLSDDGILASEARKGASLFGTADRRARDSIWLGGLSKIPFLGRPARWLRSASGTAATLGEEAAVSVDRIEPLLDAGGDPAKRLALVDLVEKELTRLQGLVRDVRLPGTGGFLPPVSSADRELRADLTRLRGALADGAIAARGLRSFLTGPSTYVVLAANNSEMRAGGMVLQVGLLGARDGRIGAGGFRSTAELVLDEPVPLPAEFASLYGWLEPDREWRNVGTSPNFPGVAPIYAAMAERTGVPRVDGVLQIDVLGVRSLLEVIGPVVIDGRRYDATNVERLVMHDLYVTYGNEQFERRHEFSRLAAEAFRTLTQGSSDLVDVARAVQRAAAGRHLMAWSPRPLEQRAWERLEIDGRLERDGFMVTVQNHAGNKLDWFIRPSVSLQVEHPEGRLRRIRARISIDNPTPSGEPTYVGGDGRFVPPGDHRAFVAVYLPGWASNVSMVGHEVLVIGTDGPMRVVATRLDIARGGSAVVEVLFNVPPEVARIILLPSARAAPVTVRLEELVVDDSVMRALAIAGAQR